MADPAYYKPSVAPLITANTTELRRFKVLADSFDKAIVRGLRKSIRHIGDGAVQEVKKTLRLPPPNDQPGTSGSREALASRTRVMLSFSKKSAGAKIVTSGTSGFAGAYNKPTFRHATFGNWNAAVNQSGRPYFGSVILEHMDGPQVQKELERVLDDAVKAIGGRG